MESMDEPADDGMGGEEARAHREQLAAAAAKAAQLADTLRQRGGGAALSMVVKCFAVPGA
jgi:hypothetical protein